jgi:hypothetical protein
MPQSAGTLDSGTRDMMGRSGPFIFAPFRDRFQNPGITLIQMMAALTCTSSGTIQRRQRTGILYFSAHWNLFAGRSRPRLSRLVHPDGVLVTDRVQGKPLANYPAYLCPLHCGGAVSHSRLRMTILHSECEDCKRFCEHPTNNLGSPGPEGLRRGLSGKAARTKKRNEGLSIGP